MKNLVKGDQVVLVSGIIGKINKIEENVIIIEVGKIFLFVICNVIFKEMIDVFFKEVQVKKFIG